MQAIQNAKRDYNKSFSKICHKKQGEHNHVSRSIIENESAEQKDRLVSRRTDQKSRGKESKKMQRYKMKVEWNE